MITLLKFCLDATYLAFRGSFYRQIHGTAMGSPVSVTVANLVMEDVEQRALATFPNPPKFWKRYVDDTCCALATSDIDQFHQHINSIEPHIQFTVEIETNGQLPFLDLLLSREEDGSISTSVYRKPNNRQISRFFIPPLSSPQSSSCTHSHEQSQSTTFLRVGPYR